MLNNPLKYTDPTGLQIDDIITITGTRTGTNIAETKPFDNEMVLGLGFCSTAFSLVECVLNGGGGSIATGCATYIECHLGGNGGSSSYFDSLTSLPAGTHDGVATAAGSDADAQSPEIVTIYGKRQTSQKERLNGEPDGALEGIFVERREWDLTVQDGVLTGEISVGCGRAAITYECGRTILKMNEVINEHQDIDISFKKHDSSGWFSGKPDITLTFKERIINDILASYDHGSRSLYFAQGSQRDGAVVLHEIGHVLGVSHRLNTTGSVMSYAPGKSSYFSQDEVFAIIGAYE